MSLKYKADAEKFIESFKADLAEYQELRDKYHNCPVSDARLLGVLFKQQDAVRKRIAVAALTFQTTIIALFDSYISATEIDTHKTIYELREKVEKLEQENYELQKLLKEEELV